MENEDQKPVNIAELLETIYNTAEKARAMYAAELASERAAKAPAPRIVPQDRYEVGDRVMVRSDLKEFSLYGKDSFEPKMKKWLGSIVTIETHRSNGGYTIEGDEDEWDWTPEMFSGKPAEDKPEPQPEKEPMARFYCFKDKDSICKLAKGKSYFLNQCGVFTFENGITSRPYESENEFRNFNHCASACLATEVKRPAKVGEWVKLKNYDLIRKITKVENKTFRTPCVCAHRLEQIPYYVEHFVYWSDDQCRGFVPDEYVVLDGFKPDTDEKWYKKGESWY